MKGGVIGRSHAALLFSTAHDLQDAGKSQTALTFLGLEIRTAGFYNPHHLPKQNHLTFHSGFLLKNLFDVG